MKTLARSSCCRRGYWNAIAYGAAVIWAFSVILYTLLVLHSFRAIPDQYLPYLTLPLKIADTFKYAYFPLIGPHEIAGWWLFGYSERMGLFFPPGMHMSIHCAVMLISFAIFCGLHWVVFLGVLRAYWWRRRAPVTGWSALAAVFVMAAYMAFFWVFLSS